MESFGLVEARKRECNQVNINILSSHFKRTFEYSKKNPVLLSRQLQYGRKYLRERCPTVIVDDSDFDFDDL